MSQTKAQLIQPIGVVTASGVVVSGVMTAGTFEGAVVGSATSIIQGTNLNLGAFNATSFGGDFTGNATGIITSSAIKVGSLTASSFVGDFTGTATSMAKGTGFKAGTVTATPANVTYAVTVGSKTGGGNAFYLDGIEAPVPSLYPGATYTFDQSDSTNGTHPLRFATAADAAGSTGYSVGVTVNGTQGSAGAYTRIVVSPSAPDTLYYYCTAHSGMGDSINITNLLQGPVTGAVTGDVKGNIAGNITGNVTGNAVGAAGSVLSGSNIHVGVMTATSYSGDGSNMTGIAATNFNTQTVTANAAETIIDLSDGNMITMNQNANTTVGFASTSTAMDVTMIRAVATDRSTGAVTFDGDDSLLSIAVSDTSLNFVAGGSITFEAFIKLTNVDKNGAAGYQSIITRWQSSNYCFGIDIRGDGALYLYHGNGNNTITTQASDTGFIEDATLYHIAVVKDGTTGRFFINGAARGTFTWNEENTNSSQAVLIGSLTSAGSAVPDGTISNVRITNGQALYTSAFTRPDVPLTTTSQGATGSNVKILCCKSSSSTTASDVTTGTITATNSPVVGSLSVPILGDQTFTITWPDSVKWNGGSAPTLITNSVAGDKQQFQFLTRDSGLTWYGWEPFKNDVLTYQLWTWGTNAESGVGALGLNDQTNRSSPTQVGTEVKWRSLAKNGIGGEGSFMGSGIKGNGTLWMWGSNSYGGLGQNQGSGSNAGSISSPVQVPGTTWDMHSVGTTYAYATKTDGSLWSWGQNNHGLLGQNTVGTGFSSPVQIGNNTNWSTVAAGDNATHAIKTDGTLWSWGAGSSGKLGQNTSPSVKYSSPTQIGTNTTWSKIFGGGSTFGIKTDGTAWAWGANTSGALAQNHRIQRSSPVQIGTGTDWNFITAQANTVLGIKDDGTMWSWGYNTAGFLGQNQAPDNRTAASSPCQIPGTTWSIGAPYENGSTAAIKTDGTMWAWGRNYRGCLGLNQQGAPPNSIPAVYSSPVQVPGNNWVDVIGGKSRVAAFRSS